MLCNRFWLAWYNSTGVDEITRLIAQRLDEEGATGIPINNALHRKLLAAGHCA